MIVSMIFVLVLVVGISRAVANSGGDPQFAATDAEALQAVPTIAPGVSFQVAEDLPLAAPPVNAAVLSPSPKVELDIWLYVPRFRQTDPLWSTNVMSTCGRTIGEAGCLLTSAAMVFKYYGASTDPGQLNTCMGDNACPWRFAPGANCSGSKAAWDNLYGFSYGTLVWALSNGWPPILELVNGNNTHWVVVNAVRGDGVSDSNYRISDPFDGTVKVLTSYTNNGWTKNRIAVYTKR